MAQLSQAHNNPPLSSTHLEWSAHFVTPEGRVRVVITKNKAKVRVAKLSRPIVHALNDDDTDYYDELPNLQVGYRRPELINQSADVELSDAIKLRLALARMRALEAYHRTWS